MRLYNTTLPIVSHTLEEFIIRATALWQENDTTDLFTRFVLTGEFVDDDGMRKQAFVDVLQNTVDDDHPLSIKRDYDSVLGIASKILVDAPISVYAVPHPTFALKTSIHLTHPISYHEVGLYFIQLGTC